MNNKWRTPLIVAALMTCGIAYGETSWSTDVVGIEEMHLTAEHWVDIAKHPDEVLIDAQGIVALVDKAFTNDANMVSLERYPKKTNGEAVREQILSISKPYKSALFYLDGRKVEDVDYTRYQANLNIAALAELAEVRFGLVVQRANMRTWPTDDVVFKSKQTIDLDRFQENGLFPANMVAVLHESTDGQWYFVQSFNYAAWVSKNAVAIGSRAEILEYKKAENFLLVTGSKATTNFNPRAPEISELQLDMGVRLPLADLENSDHNVDGQNPYASFAVRLPVNEEFGKLGFRTALIARSQDVRRGYLPFTRRHVVEQAFKFLGERYGWGHSYNARDCTGLVSEVYKTFGIQMPRNSGQQGHSPIGENIDFDLETSAADKLKAVLSADVGDLLYSTGHVMMFLGNIDGMPYVIHDLSGFGWASSDGTVQEGVLNGVSVTPLTPIYSSQDTTYFEEIYAIKKIR